jgi:ATP adenylyltransferase/5',5'''-P-1,P-4-tetraphosphate phosphorylase II
MDYLTFHFIWLIIRRNSSKSFNKISKDGLRFEGMILPKNRTPVKTINNTFLKKTVPF